MTKRMFRVAAVLVPLAAVSALLPPRDRPSPDWLTVPLLLLAVRVLAGACDRFAGSSPSFFPGEEHVYAAPFVLRILTLLAAPAGGRDLLIAAALWLLMGAAAHIAETAIGTSGRKSTAAFPLTLLTLGVASRFAPATAVLSGTAVACAALTYLQRRRRKAP